MANITGNYALHGKPGYSGLTIVAVIAGRLEAGLVDEQGTLNNIYGTYDDVTNQIVFNNASYPGEILFTTFFTGSAIFVPGTTDAFALAGTWHEQRLRFVDRRIIQFENETGSWYADCQQPIIP